MKRTGLALLLAGVVASSGCTSYKVHRFKARHMNKPVPDFTLTSLDGDEVTLSEFRGKPLLLTFFAFG